MKSASDLDESALPPEWSTDPLLLRLWLGIASCFALGTPLGTYWRSETGDCEVGPATEDELSEARGTL